MKYLRIVDSDRQFAPGITVERFGKHTLALHLILAITWPRRRWCLCDYGQLLRLAKPQAWLRISLNKTGAGWLRTPFETARGVSFVDPTDTKHIARRDELLARRDHETEIIMPQVCT